ncbi:ribonuclease 1-like [Macadamia integrifolia]|uniref:ribonuclease 1-like n=1 Tax=Macadamia integrifolia TaxID=60698 RepID=UPI001C4EF681|nr:ribonuclease 1-like [Macadamia integrifolia]
MPYFRIFQSNPSNLCLINTIFSNTQPNIILKNSICVVERERERERDEAHNFSTASHSGVTSSGCSNCDSSNSFDASVISDLTSRMQTNWPSLACPSSTGLKFWSHEWEKHGTCSESVLDQHGYFETALNLKKKVDLLQILENAGIQPDGGFYSLDSIKQAIRDGSGYTPFIECNVDDSGNSQLYQVYLCVDNSGSDFTKCPVFPKGWCDSKIEFPTF